LEIPGQQELVAAVGAWLNAPLTEQGLDRLTDVILAHYQSHDRPVVDITVPDQDLSEGALVIEITEGRIGVVGMEKSARFNNELLGKALHLNQGDLLPRCSCWALLIMARVGSMGEEVNPSPAPARDCGCRLWSGVTRVLMSVGRSRETAGQRCTPGFC